MNENRNDLPAGHEWEPAGRQASALRKGLYVLALANVDGTWTAVGDLRGTATPRPDETLLTAAQREATAALWRVDGFDVGEVRGVLVTGDPAGGGILRGGAVTYALPGLPSRWAITAERAVPTGIEVDARRVDTVASGEHATDCAYFFADAADAESLCNCGKTALANTEHLATPESDGGLTGAASDVEPGANIGRPSRHRIPGHAREASCDARCVTARPRREDAVGLVREPFVPSARAAAETLDVLRRVGDGDADELARLLLALRPAIPLVLGWFDVSSPAYRLARACELLTRERERLTAIVNALEGDFARVRAANAYDAAELHAARARVAELEAELSDLRAMHAETAKALYVAAPEAYRALDDARMRAMKIDTKLGPAVADRLRAEMRKKPAPDHAADALALTLAAEQGVRGWLRAHGHDPDARPWDETVIALDAPPAGWRVAGLLARAEEAGRGAAENVDDDATYHAAGAVSAYKDARRLIRDAFPAPSALDGVVAEVLALNQRPHPDSEATPDDYLDHVGTLAEDGLPLDEPWEDVETVRDRLKWGAAMCLAGLLACDAKGGSS